MSSDYTKQLKKRLGRDLTQEETEFLAGRISKLDDEIVYLDKNSNNFNSRIDRELESCLNVNEIDYQRIVDSWIAGGCQIYDKKPILIQRGQEITEHTDEVTRNPTSYETLRNYLGLGSLIAATVGSLAIATGSIGYMLSLSSPEPVAVPIAYVSPQTMNPADHFPEPIESNMASLASIFSGYDLGKPSPFAYRDSIASTQFNSLYSNFPSLNEEFSFEGPYMVDNESDLIEPHSVVWRTPNDNFSIDYCSTKD